LGLPARSDTPEVGPAAQENRKSLREEEKGKAAYQQNCVLAPAAILPAMRQPKVLQTRDNKKSGF
jgi:hypothetical protein